MNISSFHENLEFQEGRVKTNVIIESAFSKEIRILMKRGQVMKEHKAPFPIVVHVLVGEIEFGVEGISYPMKMGDIIALEGNIPHDLKAVADSVIRLTLSKLDKVERVENVGEA